MFERYTEKARRIIFFARYEASQYGSPYIEVPHLLLGIVRESIAIFRLVSNTDGVTIHKAIKDLCIQSGERTATSVDLPLSQACKQCLAFAAEEAKTLEHEHIGPEHVLLGVLRLHGPEAGVLAGFGIALESAREAFRAWPGDPAAAPRPPKAEASNPRHTLAGLLLQVPVDRLDAAIKILTALRSPYFSASGVSSEGTFSYSFGEVPPAA